MASAPGKSSALLDSMGGVVETENGLLCFCMRCKTAARRDAVIIKVSTLSAVQQADDL